MLEVADLAYATHLKRFSTKMPHKLHSIKLQKVTASYSHAIFRPSLVSENPFPCSSWQPRCRSPHSGKKSESIADALPLHHSSFPADVSEKSDPSLSFIIAAALLKQRRSPLPNKPHSKQCRLLVKLSLSKYAPEAA